jgi:hypothetical protein
MCDIGCRLSDIFKKNGANIWITMRARECHQNEIDNDYCHLYYKHKCIEELMYGEYGGTGAIDPIKFGEDCFACLREFDIANKILYPNGNCPHKVKVYASYDENV